ncbi:Uncharacterised protein [Legionella busanensis]|uniref:Uncharacterized protein n=1 Tax=Legionella busanensis TaxID=190655 RepID=A0A378JH60_9GAMM|nr:hypothetical protein [Legionella busanensis]STX50464.1 Uncharacterised protein [Legionella busanensis]
MKTEWKKVDDDWYEKKTINEQRVPVFTYHYKRKSASPTPTILLKTKLAQNLCGYILIKKDIKDTILFIQEHNKLVQTSDNIGKNIILKGLTRAIVITYGKCFTDADGRKIRLDKKFIKTKTNQEIHALLMEMRNQYVAHAGKSIHEKICLSLLCPPPKEVNKVLRGKNVKGKIILEQQLFQTTSTIEFNDGTVLSLLNELRNSLDKKISQIQEKLGLENLDPVKLWNLVKRNKVFHIDEVILEKIQQK